MRRADRRYWKMRRAIIFALWDTGNYTQGEIADLVGLGRTGVNYHLTRRSKGFRWIVTNVPSRINESMKMRLAA